MKLFFCTLIIFGFLRFIPALSMNSAGKDIEHLFVYKHVSGWLKGPNGQCPTIPDVAMDRYEVARGKNPILSTTGVSTCIAVCGLGKSGGENVIALGHASNLLPPACTLAKITRELRMQGCPYSTISIFLIGGNPDQGSSEIQKGYIALTEPFQIRGFLFNPLNIDDIGEISDEDSYYDQHINIILTPNALYFGDQLRIKSPREMYDCGKDDWDDNEPIPPAIDDF